MQTLKQLNQSSCFLNLCPSFACFFLFSLSRFALLNHNFPNDSLIVAVLMAKKVVYSCRTNTVHLCPSLFLSIYTKMTHFIFQIHEYHNMCVHRCSFFNTLFTAIVPAPSHSYGRASNILLPVNVACDHSFK